MFSRSNRRPQANGITITRRSSSNEERRQKGEARERKTKERLKSFTRFRRFVKRGRSRLLAFFSFFSNFFFFARTVAPILTVAWVRREVWKRSANATACRAKRRFFSDVGTRRVEKTPMKKNGENTFLSRERFAKVAEFFLENRESREKNEKISAPILERAGGRWYNGNRRVPVSVAKRRL